MELKDPSKWMTVRKLIDKLTKAVESGELKENSVVIGCADEFDYFYPISEDSSLAYDLSEDIEQCEHMVEYYRNKMSGDEPRKAKERQVERLKKLNENGCCWLRGE